MINNILVILHCFRLLLQVLLVYELYEFSFNCITYLFIANKEIILNIIQM